MMFPMLQQHEAEQLAEYQTADSGLDDELLASRPRGRAGRSVAATAAPAEAPAVPADPDQVAAQRKAARRAQYAARREKAAAAKAAAEAPAVSDGDVEDVPEERPTKRAKGRKPKPKPAPFVHGPRITSSASEADEEDPDDLVFNKVCSTRVSHCSIPRIAPTSLAMCSGQTWQQWCDLIVTRWCQVLLQLFAAPKLPMLKLLL